jgi:hypothetical protein
MNTQAELPGFLAVTDELLSLLEPLDDERVNRIPFPGSWTAGQLGEHLLKSYRAIDLSRVQSEPCPRPSGEKSPRIDAVFLDFTTKYQPPEFIVPSAERISGRDLVESLRQTVDGIAAFVRERDLSFTCPDFAIIGFGELTAQEWIRFLTAHSRRHVRQLKNILARLPGASERSLVSG